MIECLGCKKYRDDLEETTKRFMKKIESLEALITVIEGELDDARLDARVAEAKVEELNCDLETIADLASG